MKIFVSPKAKIISARQVSRAGQNGSDFFTPHPNCFLKNILHRQRNFSKILSALQLVFGVDCIQHVDEPRLFNYMGTISLAMCNANTSVMSFHPRIFSYGILRGNNSANVTLFLAGVLGLLLSCATHSATHFSHCMSLSDS